MNIVEATRLDHSPDHFIRRKSWGKNTRMNYGSNSGVPFTVGSKVGETFKFMITREDIAADDWEVWVKRTGLTLAEATRHFAATGIRRASWGSGFAYIVSPGGQDFFITNWGGARYEFKREDVLADDWEAVDS